MAAPPPESPPQQNGRLLTAVNAIKQLSFTNLLTLFLVLLMGLPTYVIWKALSDDKLMDRLMSTYEEFPDQASGCLLRHVQERGGPDMWGVSTGFAFRGADRWFVSVLLIHQPGNEEFVSYCESLKLIADTMLARGGANGALGVPGQ